MLRRYLEYRGYAGDLRAELHRRRRQDHPPGQRGGHHRPRPLSEQLHRASISEDAHGLGVRDATIHPKATENIARDHRPDPDASSTRAMPTQVERGRVLPRGASSPTTASSLRPAALRTCRPGARDRRGRRARRIPLDFALWKAAKPGEPYWESPWGMGRPGWHIECSAMSQPATWATPSTSTAAARTCIFPHHENEIAQVRVRQRLQALRPLLDAQRLPQHRQPEDVQVPGQLLHRPGGCRGVRVLEAVRFFMLSAHYRSPLNYSAGTQLTMAQSSPWSGSTPPGATWSSW